MQQNSQISVIICSFNDFIPLKSCPTVTNPMTNIICDFHGQKYLIPLLNFENTIDIKIRKGKFNGKRYQEV